MAILYNNSLCFVFSFVVCVVCSYIFPISSSIIGKAGRLKDGQRFPTIIDSKAGTSQFKAYWNIPSFQCKPHGIYFTDVYKKYGIIQNTEDTFRGDKFSILYDPGNFPALIENERSKSYEFRNGGVPQKGDLDLHLRYFKDHVNQQIPDEDYNGISVIDFESWRPVFRQNFGSLQPYKDESYKVERSRHPFWPQSWIEKEAEKNFEYSGRKFVEETMLLAKKMRPSAKWGYYAYPYCFNMNPKNKIQECSDNIQRENDNIQWMWDASHILLPSIYFNSKQLNARERQQCVAGRTNEAKRIQSRTNEYKEIMLYFWFKYQDDQETFLAKEDVYDTINYMHKQGLEGIILWGSSNDVNSKDKCLALRDYVDNILGPAIKEFTQTPRQRSMDDSQEELDEHNTTFYNVGPTRATNVDNEPINSTTQDYTRTISSYTDSTKPLMVSTENINKARADDIEEDSLDASDSIEHKIIVDANSTAMQKKVDNVHQINNNTRSATEITIHEDKVDSDEDSESNEINRPHEVINNETIETEANEEKDNTDNKTVESGSERIRPFFVWGKFFGYRGPYVHTLRSRK